MISNKLCNFISLYRSPSQSSDEFENFVYNLDLTLEALTQKNPFLTVIIGDFNAKFNKWCSTDKTTPEGAKLDNLTSQYGLTQLLKEPTHISDSYRSCIDLIFTSQPNLVVDFGIHPNASIMTENENSVVRTLLFGRPDFNFSTTKENINATISFILNTKRFNCPLF